MGLFRLLLAVSVFMAHTINPKWIHGFGGENAVEIFFVISGFYIALILDKTYDTKKSFYLNRFLRLYPMYYIVCALVILRAVLIPEFREVLLNFPSQVLVLVNLANSFISGTDWVMFLQWREGGIHLGSYLNSELQIFTAMLIPQAWSLGIEVVFYLFAPLICKLRTRSVLFLGIFLIVIKGIAWIKGLNQDPWSYRFFIFELPMFIFGILLYRFRKSNFSGFRISLGVIYVLTGVFYFGIAFINSNLHLDRKIQFMALLMLVSVIILFGEQSSFDTKIGELSYPFYISHILVISTVIWLSNRIQGPEWFLTIKSSVWFPLVTGLLLTTLLSMLLIRVNQPIERLRSRNRTRPSNLKIQTL